MLSTQSALSALVRLPLEVLLVFESTQAWTHSDKGNSVLNTCIYFKFTAILDPFAEFPDIAAWKKKTASKEGIQT